MIVAKTKMAEMPQRCNECSLSVLRPGWPKYYRTCRISGSLCSTETDDNGNTRYIKPDDCPLIEI